MASAPPDDTQLKRRARRRLIGAIALVLLAVILLPMIFDAERKPLDQDILIQIPNQGDYVSHAPPVAKPTPGTGQPAAVTLPSAPSAAPPAQAPKAEGAPKAESKAEIKPEATAEAKADTKAQAKAEAKAPKEATDSRTDAQKARELADAKRAEALLNGAAVAPNSEKKADKGAEGAFAVQVGAFSTDEKVQEARDKLGAAGVKTYVEKIPTKEGEVTRVRAGPYASKDAAQLAQGKISGLGFGNAKVVTR